jgi:voltage-gated potassium channel
MSGQPTGERSVFEREFLPASEHGLRYKLYRLIYHHDAPDERNFDLVLIVAILTSVLVVLLDSVGAIKARWHGVLYAAEWFFTVLFTLEYAVRLWTVRRPVRYATSFFGVIDLLSILPTYLSLFFPASASLLVVRSLRLLRVFRVLKLVEYSGEAGILVDALLRSRRKILVFLSAILTVVIIFGAIMYVIEGPEHGFHSIPTGMYWAVVTMATVGFGDIAPGTPLGRFVTSILILIGYSVIAVPTGIYTAELASTMREAEHNEKRDGRGCLRCGLEGHAPDARYCRQCAEPLPELFNQV